MRVLAVGGSPLKRNLGSLYSDFIREQTNPKFISRRSTWCPKGVHSRQAHLHSHSPDSSATRPPVLWISLLTAMVCETISYFVIHQSSHYMHLRSSTDKASKKLDSLEIPSASASSKNPKKIDRFDSSLKESNRDLSLFKFKSGFVVAVAVATRSSRGRSS